MPGNIFDSRSFIATESVENNETQNVSTAPYKNAKRVISVDSSGNVIGGFNLKAYDYVSRTLSPTTTETYVFKSGGASGTTVATVVIVYTYTTLTYISTVTKT